MLLCIRSLLPVFQVHMGNYVDHSYSFWYDLTKLNFLTKGLIYHKTKLVKTENNQIVHAVEKFSNDDCITIGDLSHENLKWLRLESTEGNYQKFVFMTQGNFHNWYVLGSTRGTQ